MIILEGYNAMRAQMMGDDIHAISKTIMMVTGGPYSHTEGRQSGGDVDISYSAEYGVGFRKKPIRYSNRYRWDDLIMPWSKTQEDDCVGIWEDMLVTGFEYDNVGVLGRATDLNILKPDPVKIWCSKSFCRGAFQVDKRYELFMNQYGFDENIDPTPLMLMTRYYVEAKEKS